MTTVNPLTRNRPRPPRRLPIPPSQSSTRRERPFGTGDYAGALRLTDEALKVLPNDATLHEFRALVLFAVGKYDLAAGPLYAVLSVGPGWDWTTMAGLYPDIEVYTSQLRKLEAFVSANPTSTAGRFVLAYHYLTQGNTDAAVGQFKGVVALAPQDTLSAQLVKQFSPPSAAPETPAAATAPPPATTPAKQGNLAGNWTAHPAGDTTIDLRIGDDSTFTWKVTAKGKPRQLAGKWSLTDDLLTLGARRRRRGAGRPCLLASRRQVELPRDRDGARGSRINLRPLTAPNFTFCLSPAGSDWAHACRPHPGSR